ncbi:MAG: helix-turn-helix transcriptional regulator [Ruminococcaceae bacterium]|nr:helix-turn-helix transcriptional regulator [Oscillospiraceae bacterium]
MRIGVIMKQIDYKALGARIREARKKNNITQEKLGEICSLSTAHIGHIERGTRIPSLETIVKISSELGVSTDYLLIDSAANTDNILYALSRQIEGKDETKIKSFISAVKALADNIDNL